RRSRRVASRCASHRASRRLVSCRRGYYNRRPWRSRSPFSRIPAIPRRSGCSRRPAAPRPSRRRTTAASAPRPPAADPGGGPPGGGRGRCPSCRIKSIAGTIPPRTLADEVQLGDDLVREGYRLACQCRVDEPLTVQLAPPLEEQAFQILGAGPSVARTAGVVMDSGVVKHVVKV